MSRKQRSTQFPFCRLLDVRVGLTTMACFALLSCSPHSSDGFKSTLFSKINGYLHVRPSAESAAGPRISVGDTLFVTGELKGWLIVQVRGDTAQYFAPLTDVSYYRPETAASGGTTAGLIAKQRKTSANSLSGTNPELVRTSRQIVNTMIDRGALEKIDGLYTVRVGPAFFSLDPKTRLAVCQAIAIIRVERGNSASYLLKDATTGSTFAEFNGSSLVFD